MDHRSSLWKLIPLSYFQQKGQRSALRNDATVSSFVVFFLFLIDMTLFSLPHNLTKTMQSALGDSLTVLSLRLTLLASFNTTTIKMTLILLLIMTLPTELAMKIVLLCQESNLTLLIMHPILASKVLTPLRFQ